jgi:AP-1 complex subunit mu
MVASAIFITDTKGKVIIARNYRGDIPMAASEKYRITMSAVFNFTNL